MSNNPFTWLISVRTKHTKKLSSAEIVRPTTFHMQLNWLHYLTYVTTCHRHRSRESDLLFIFEQNSALTWTLSPFSRNGYQAPSAVTLKYNSDSVFFAETIVSQLLPNGSGFGTFDTEQAGWAEEADGGQVAPSALQAVAGNPTSGYVEPGSTLM